MPTLNAVKVFLCHASEDKDQIIRLYNQLRDSGVQPWLDKKNLIPGTDWNYEIRKAVRSSDVVLVCLSRNSVNKSGYLQKEIREALDVADEKPEGMIYLIPVRLDSSHVPDRLSRWQWVDLFEESGYGDLMVALQTIANVRANSMAAAANSVKSHTLDRSGLERTGPLQDAPLRAEPDMATTPAVDLALGPLSVLGWLMKVPAVAEPGWKSFARRVSKMGLDNDLLISGGADEQILEATCQLGDLDKTGQKKAILSRVHQSLPRVYLLPRHPFEKERIRSLDVSYDVASMELRVFLNTKKLAAFRLI